MIDKVWLQIGASVLGGGAAGAIINSIVTAARDSLPKINYRIDKKGIFKTSEEYSSIRPEIILHHGDNAVTYSNLSTVDVFIGNPSNRDFDSFDFGITLQNGDRCIFSEELSLDRHHSIVPKISPTPDTPLTELDFVLNPFNRKDAYWLRLYLTTDINRQSSSKCIISSKAPVRLVEVSQAADTILKFAELVVKFGPLKIGIG